MNTSAVSFSFLVYLQLIWRPRFYDVIEVKNDAENPQPARIQTTNSIKQFQKSSYSKNSTWRETLPSHGGHYEHLTQGLEDQGPKDLKS